jgi:hypothetical protein
MEGNAYVNFCTWLQLVSNLQIGEIAHKFETGELVSKICGKIWTCKFTNLLANLVLRRHSTVGPDVTINLGNQVAKIRKSKIFALLYQHQI